MKKDVVFVCSVKGTPQVDFIRREAKSSDITQIADIPESAIQFWFEIIDQNDQKIVTPITFIGKIFTREEILNGCVPEIAPELIKNIDCDGIIKTRVDGLWSWYQNGMRVIDLP